MKVKNMGSLKSRVRRQQVKCKTHLERLCRIGANRPGAQSGKELIRTLAGKTAQAAAQNFCRPGAGADPRRVFPAVDGSA